MSSVSRPHSTTGSDSYWTSTGSLRLELDLNRRPTRATLPFSLITNPPPGSRPPVHGELVAHTATHTGPDTGTGTDAERQVTGTRHQARQYLTEPRVTRFNTPSWSVLTISLGPLARIISLSHTHHRGLTPSDPPSSLGPWPSLSAHHFIASLIPRAVRRGDGKRGLGWPSTTSRFPIRASLSQIPPPTRLGPDRTTSNTQGRFGSRKHPSLNALLTLWSIVARRPWDVHHVVSGG